MEELEDLVLFAASRPLHILLYSNIYKYFLSFILLVIRLNKLLEHVFQHNTKQQKTLRKHDFRRSHRLYVSSQSDQL